MGHASGWMQQSETRAGMTEILRVPYHVMKLIGQMHYSQVKDIFVSPLAQLRYSQGEMEKSEGKPVSVNGQTSH